MRLIAGRYQQGEAIGAGAMGDVFRGVDTETGDPVAIKVLKQAMRDSEHLERFVREANALRDLDHPNIVKLLDYIEEDAHQYLIMEYVAGGDLQTLLHEKPKGLPIKQTLNIALDLCDALTRAHRLDIIHRDLKPANILMAADGTPRLTDFGVAHFGGQTELTADGAVVGTFAYLSPEAVLGLDIDARADIWTLGVILSEMLTGQQPFDGTTPGSIINAILNAPLPDFKVQRSDLPDDLLDLLYRMLEKSRDARIPSVRLVGAEVEAMLKGQTGTITLRAPTPTSTTQEVGNLPHQTTPFVGRQAELAELARLITDPAQRLITVLGPGGMGKTRLSIEAASRVAGFIDGAMFVRLAPLEQADNIPVAIGEAFNYTFTEAPSPKEQILTVLSNKNLLLVMDNFEHVIEGATLVADILTHAPRVTVLASSRERLNLSAETVFSIAGMDFPDWETPEDALQYSAVQLFMQSAQRVQVGFELDEANLTYVARICRLVAGMPLGILLAAAWVDMLNLEEIAAEITQSFDFLESDMRDLPERQQSMRAVFNYSWAMLDEAERDALTCMSVFRGGCRRQAAQRVTGAGLRMLNTLVNKSLVARETSSGRYTMHELIRQYAEENLLEQGQAGAARTQHAEYYLGWLADLEEELKGGRQKGALDEAEADFDNLRAAWLYAVDQKRIDLIEAALTSLRLVIDFRGRYQEGLELIHAARNQWAEGNPLAGRLLTAYPEREDDPAVVLERALSIVQTHGTPGDVAQVKNELGRYLAHKAVNPERGIALLEEVRETFHTLDQPFDEARAMDDLAFAYTANRLPKDRLQLIEETIAIRRRIGDRIGLGNALRNQGGSYQVNGQLDKATRAWAEAGEIAAEMGDLLNEAWCMALMSEMHLINNEVETARQRLQRVRDIAEETNLPIVHALVEAIDALDMATSGREEEAISLAEDLMQRFGFDPFFTGTAISAKSIALCNQAQYRAALVFASEMIFPNAYGFAYPLLAIPAAALSPDEDGARWLGCMHKTEANSAVYGKLPFFVEIKTKIREAIGVDAFDEAWQSGTQMAIGDAIDEIRSKLL